jgi:hypothetical protein
MRRWCWLDVGNAPESARPLRDDHRVHPMIHNKPAPLALGEANKPGAYWTGSRDWSDMGSLSSALAGLQTSQPMG